MVTYTLDGINPKQPKKSVYITLKFLYYRGMTLQELTTKAQKLYLDDSGPTFSVEPIEEPVDDEWQKMLVDMVAAHYIGGDKI